MKNKGCGLFIYHHKPWAHDKHVLVNVPKHVLSKFVGSDFLYKYKSRTKITCTTKICLDVN